MVDLVPYSQFGSLRLANFLPAGADIVEVADWEFMDDRWLGESTGGFTEFLRLEDDPDVVRSIALDLAALPRNTSDAVLRAIGLPLQPAMTEEAILATLGQPTSVEQFPSVPDRRTLNFVCGTREAYTVSCTVHEASGLIYVVVMTPTPRRFST